MARTRRATTRSILAALLAAALLLPSSGCGFCLFDFTCGSGCCVDFRCREPINDCPAMKSKTPDAALRPAGQP